MGSTTDTSNSSSSSSQSTSSSSAESQNTSSSLGIGYSTSSTSESALSLAQLESYNNREQQYNEFFFPELQNALAQTDVNSEAGKAVLNQQTQQINSAFDDSSRQITQNLSQQNLLGNASGVQASLNAQNSRAKASSLADAYYNTLADSNEQKLSLLGLSSSLMTTPTTTGASYYQDSQSVDVSTSESQGTSSMESESQSTSGSSSSGSSTSWTLGG